MNNLKMKLIISFTTVSEYQNSGYPLWKNLQGDPKIQEIQNSQTILKNKEFER